MSKKTFEEFVFIEYFRNIRLATITIDSRWFTYSWYWLYALVLSTLNSAHIFYSKSYYPSDEEKEEDKLFITKHILQKRSQTC